jgi:hypothetical protein
MNQNYPVISKSLPPFLYFEMGGWKGGPCPTNEPPQKSSTAPKDGETSEVSIGLAASVYVYRGGPRRARR